MGLNMKFVSISSLQRTTKPMLENDVVCIMKNNEPAFYSISVKQMEYLKKCESMISDDEKMNVYDSVFWGLNGENK